MKKKTIQVLLLEDNPGDARLFREYLHNDDLIQVELVHVERLMTGLAHLAKAKPDVILLDLGLPDSQGLETFTQIYSQAQDVPIVVLTGLDDAGQAVESVRSGAQDYLVKGEVSSGLLVRAICYAIERKQAEVRRRIVAETLARFLQADDLMEIYRFTAEQVSHVVGDGIVFTTMLDEVTQTLQVVSIAGLDIPLEKIIQILGVDPTQIVYRIEDIVDDDLRSYRSGRLERLEGGIYTLSTRKLSQVLCEAVETILRVDGIYTMGFVWHGLHYGGMTILARGNLAPHTETIELIVDQAGIAINRLRAEKALRESEDKFHGLFHWMGGGIQICELVFDEESQPVDYIILDVNPAYEKYFGLRREQVVGRRVKEFFPSGEQAWLDHYGELVRTGEPVHFEEYETSLHQWFDVYACPMNGNRFAAIFSDITGRKQADEILKSYSENLQAEVENRTCELRYAQEQLVRRERLATLGQLAGSVGHELRNPLGVISNAVYYLNLVQPDANEVVKEYLGIIKKETVAAEKIITDLLDFSRIQSLNREAVSVARLVQQAQERFPVPAPILVSIETPLGLPSVYADPQQIVQVLGNLVVNACQAMPDGGKLTISAVVQNDRIAIEVQDTGGGIPPENMSKLFEPLFTTKAKGIGLGLTICKNLVEANGGRIEVQSEPGHGSTFTIFLPFGA
jgi:PAS domain S-box-containing protein